MRSSATETTSQLRFCKFSKTNGHLRTMTPTPRSNLHPARLAIVALVVWSGGAARGDSLTAQQRELREREIANKSEAERARLQRNFRAFRELPADEQQRLRNLDLELKEDARNLGSLRVVMNEYYDW